MHVPLRSLIHPSYGYRSAMASRSGAAPRSGVAAGAAVTSTAAGATAAPTKLSILALGDSLTEGFTDGGMEFHPYALRLRSALLERLPPGSSVAVNERGRSGEFVIPEMQARLRRTLDEAAAAGRSYDWVLLLGGTNDITSDAAAADVLRALASMHAAAAATGARVAAFTLPALNVQWAPPRMQQQHAALNDGLRALWATTSESTNAAAAGPVAESARQGGSSPAAAAAAGAAAEGQQAPSGSVLIDLDRLIPSMGQDPEEEARLWDDGVHLTAEGYNFMGEAAANALLAAMGFESGKAS